MSLLALILKGMRQRGLGSSLTALSVALGTAMGVALLVLGREAPKLFGQREFGYNVVVGGKGDSLQLVLNNVFLLGTPPGLVDYGVYEQMTGDGRYADLVETAVPILWGDTHRQRRILGTTGAFFDGLSPTVGNPVRLAAGEPFEEATWQAVLGSEAAKALDAGVGYRFQAMHGDEETGHLHDEEWTVVGVMAPTGTALDEAIFTPLATQFAFGSHGEAVLEQQEQRRTAEEIGRLYEAREAELEAIVASGGQALEGYVLTPEGRVLPRVPRALWRLSGILAETPGTFATSRLLFAINNGDAATAAVPAREMAAFYDTFLRTPSRLLLVVTVGVTLVAAVSILVGIYNSVQARRQEVAVLRALGATRAKVLVIVAGEALAIGVIGGVVGMVAGHLLAGAVGLFLTERLGGSIAWWAVSASDGGFVVGVILLSLLAGLVPAILAYKTPVAEHL